MNPSSTIPPGIVDVIVGVAHKFHVVTPQHQTDQQLQLGAREEAAQTRVAAVAEGEIGRRGGHEGEVRFRELRVDAADDVPGRDGGSSCCGSGGNVGRGVRRVESVAHLREAEGLKLRRLGIDARIVVDAVGGDGDCGPVREIGAVRRGEAVGRGDEAL